MCQTCSRQSLEPLIALDRLSKTTSVESAQTLYPAKNLETMYIKQMSS